MVVLSNPGTYGTRKCSSWCVDIHKSKNPDYKHPETQHSKNQKIQKSKEIQKSKKIQKSKNPKLQKSKNPKSQNFLHLRNLTIVFGFLDLWVFGLLDFLCFTLVFPICRNRSEIGFEKNDVCISIHSVFKGCACRRGRVTIYIYMYITCMYVNTRLCIYICVYHTYMCIYIYIHIYTCTYVSTCVCNM